MTLSCLLSVKFTKASPKLLLFFLLLPGFFSNAQSPPLNPSIKAYPPSVFEEHPQVFCSAKDPAGGVWFGVIDKVLFYNGEDWEKTHISSSTAVFDISIGHRGRVWIGGHSEFGYLRPVPSSDTTVPTANEALSPKDSDGRSTTASPGEMEYVSLTHLVPDSLQDFNNVWRVHPMGERVTFNSNKAVFVLDKDGLKALHPQNKFFKSYKVNGTLWAEDIDKGIYRLRKGAPDKSGRDKAPHLEKLPGSEPLAKKTIARVLPTVQGMTQEKEVLVLTEKNGLYRYRYGNSLKEGEERIIPIGEEWRSFYKKMGLYYATPLVPEKNPWNAALVLSTIKKGAILVDTTGRPVHVFDQKKGMTSNFVWRTVKGASGSGMLWSATNKGIVRWTPGDPRTFEREGKAFKGRVSDIVRHRGELFISTQQGVYVRKKGGRPGEDDWRPVPGTKGQCNDLLVTEKEDQGNGSLLLAGLRISEIRREEGDSKEGGTGWRASRISKKGPYALTELPASIKGQWIASTGRSGIVLLSKEDGEEWREELHIKELPEKGYSIQAISSEGGGSIDLWCGFRTKGAFRVRLDPSFFSELRRADSLKSLRYGELSKIEGVELTEFIGKGAERKGLPNEDIQLFAFRDRILAGTDSGAFRTMQRAKGELHWVPDSSLTCRFGNCPDEEKGKTKGIFRLRKGEDGSVWVGFDQVYHLLQKENGGYRIDSLPFKGMGLGSVRSIYPESNGITWIGGDNGLVRYDERIAKDFERKYHCLLREVSAPLKDSGRKKKDSILFGGFYRRPTPKDSMLGWERVREQPEAFVPTLPYRMNGLIFRFAAPYYEGQEDLGYSYRLEGFDDGWSRWKKETRKEYTNLPEGSYVFKVKAKNVYGVESRVAEYRFRILPPWYRTWTAYGGYSLAGIGLIWLISWLNSRRLLMQKQRLEQTVEERTREIREHQKETERQKEEVERAHQALEESHREITASIDYAQKIQNALLQSEERISEHFPDHFILFKPQATVSGDFYWTKERNGHLYFAVVDCTGHGVPGAFMSMLGISQLNEIMAAHEEPSPGEILTRLRERVVRELSGSDSEGGAKDGMDAAMVKVPLNEGQGANTSSNPKKVQFAGANNPLYVVKEGIADDPSVRKDRDPSVQERIKPFKKSSDGFEIKGDKMAVGYEPDAADAFTTTELEVPEGAMLYLFSDGYADQFGGEKGKKFRYGPFKELLASIHQMKPEEQKAELERIFEEWKTGKEQIDDVCVLGIRVDRPV